MEVKTDIYAEARRRLVEPANIPKAGKSKCTESEKAASRRYSKTEKGKAANHKKCCNWQKSHPEEVYEYVVKFRAKFEAEHGMKYGTYLYRKKHGLEIPEIKKAG